MKKEIKLKEVLGTGWELTTKNFTYFLVLLLISLGINIVFAIIMEAINPSEKTNYASFGNFNLQKTTTAFILNLISWIINSIIALGLIKICLSLLNGKKLPIKELFSENKKLFKYVLASLLKTAIAIAPFFTVSMLGIFFAFFKVFDDSYRSIYLLLGLAGIASIAWAVFVSVRLCFFPYYLVEKNSSTLESIKSSFLDTRQRFWQIFILILANFFINLAGLLAVGVGLFLTFPITLLAMTRAYKIISSKEETEEVVVQNQEPLVQAVPIN